MATYLLATLFLAADPPLSREAAFDAARNKYDAMILAASKAHFENDIKAKKNAIARAKKSVIDPAVPGQTLTEDGQVQFPNAESKQRAVSDAIANLAKSEADFELWKNGALKVSPGITSLEFSKLAIGQVGALSGVVVISILDGNTALVRMTSPHNLRLEITPVEISGRSTQGWRVSDDPVLIRGVFWVSGKRTTGKQSIFVIEPLFSD